METKARFISQVMTGESAARKAEDIGGQELSYAEVKAIASGNPAVLTLAEADAELGRLAILKKNHADEQFLARRALRELPETIRRQKDRLAGLSADLATAAAHADDSLAIGGRAVPRQEEASVLGRRLDSLPDRVRQTERHPLGRYRGLAFGVALHPGGTAEAYLEGAATRHAMLSRDHRGPRAVLNALERIAGSYGGQCDATRTELTIAEGQLRDFEARVGLPYPHDRYLAQLADLRDRLKAGLSQGTPEPGTEQTPVAELAAQITTLKAAHMLDATPERAKPRRLAAETPVSTRIRRPAVEPVNELPPPEQPAATPARLEVAKPVATQAAEMGPAVLHLFPQANPAPAPQRQPAYREQVTMGRKSGDRQLSLF